MWTKGSDNAPLPEKSIRRTLDIVYDFLKEACLHPFPEKTRTFSHSFAKEWEKVDANLRFDVQKIDKVAEHSILGVSVHSRGDPTGWIEGMRGT